MTLIRTPSTKGKVDISFADCPYCGTPLDTPLNEGGDGTDFPRHWAERCPANPLVEVS